MNWDCGTGDWGLGGQWAVGRPRDDVTGVSGRNWSMNTRVELADVVT